MDINVVMTANDRPNYFTETLRSWKRAYGRPGWSLAVFCEPSTEQANMHMSLGRAEISNVTFTLNSTKLGVLHNPWSAMNTLFEMGSPFVVLAEDDIVVSDDVMLYFDWAQNEFKDNPEVLGICAFSHDDGPEEEVALVDFFCPLVWGTWKDRWDNIIRDSWKLHTGPPNQEVGWDWEMQRQLKNRNMKFVFPRASRSNHIGELNGTHMTPSFFPNSQSKSFKGVRSLNINYCLEELK